MQTEPDKVTIKDFEQLRVLGRGSYAKVTLVRRLKDEQIYALKILKKNYIEKKRQEEHTQTERNVLVECDHPFIIHLKHSFQSETKLFFVLEFCQGGELFNLLCNRKRFSEEVARFYSSQMVLALEYLHSKDIVYRDLKPENVLIDNVGYIRITDFGLSKRNISGNDAKSVCGTPEYLAPEVLLKQGHGKSVDWWTLGCIIFEMITGLPPYYSNDRKTLFDNIKNQPVNFPATLSPQLKDLLGKLFSKSPETRLGAQSADEIKQHPWFAKCDWNSILTKKVKPPFIPQIKSQFDVSNFDTEFTGAEIHSVTEESLNGKQYLNFTYTENDMHEYDQVVEQEQQQQQQANGDAMDIED